MMNETADQRWSRGALAALITAIILAGILAYANSFLNDFVWDDVSFILRQQHAPQPYAVTPLFTEDQHAYGRGQGNFYRPLVAASYLVDFALSGGVNPDNSMETGTTFFHLTNLAWHLAAALLLLALLRRAAAPVLVQALAPLLYVVHPLHTEAVTYISGRADPMAAAFMFAGLWFALERGSPRRQWISMAASLACFVGALLSKESALIYPGLLLLFLLFQPARQLDGAPKRFAAHWTALGGAVVVLALYIVLRATVLRFADPVQDTALPLGERIVTMLQAFALYAKLIVLPVGLHMERTIQNLGAGTTAAGLALLVLVIAALVVCTMRNQRRAALGLAWFLLTWLPISGIFPLNAPMAEHWLYVPLAGLLWAIAEGVAALAGRSRAAGAVALVALIAAGIAWAGLTAQRNRDWHNNEQLFRATLAQNPDSARVHYNLAVTYEDLLHNPAGAKRHYAEVLRIYDAERQQGLHAGAVDEQELESHLSLAELYAAENRCDEAAPHFRAVLEATQAENSLHGMAAYGMGRCFLLVGEPEQARLLFERAAISLPDLKDHMKGLLGAPR
jgi:tetratricopeptide (TPR) repeat protein